MSAWIDAISKIGAPAVLLMLVMWKLWPLLVGFIDEAKRQAAKQAEQLDLANRRIQETMSQQVLQQERLHDEFLTVLQKYNASNAEIANQLANLNRSVDTIISAPPRKRR